MANHLGIDIGSGEACVPSPPGAGHAPDDERLAEILAGARSVAVVGLSPQPSRTSHRIGAWLQENTHYELSWVNPVAAGEEVLGQRVYASLADLPVAPDIVDVFRRSEHVPPVADDAVAVGASTLFLQLGIVNENAAATARAAGLHVIQNRCIKVEYSRLRDLIEAA